MNELANDELIPKRVQKCVITASEREKLYRSKYGEIIKGFIHCSASIKLAKTFLLKI